MTELKQIELDCFERGVLNMLFGEDYENNKMYRLATLTYGNQINDYISRFEALMEPLMLDNGLVNGAKLREIVGVKYPQYKELVPATNFRLMSLLNIVNSIIYH